MKSESKKCFWMTGLLFLLFAAFTVLVSVADVQPVGPEQSEIGLATLNRWVFDKVGVNLLWYEVTEWLGIAAILVACGFALVGFWQLLKRKSLLKVDRQLLLLGVCYGLMAAAYLFFEKVVINYRPVLLEGALEASYPSSHTMLVVCIMGTAMLEFRRLLAKRKGLCAALEGLSLLMIAVMVVGRLLSGVHWLTDIAAGLLLAAALVMLYASAVKWSAEKAN